MALSELVTIEFEPAREPAMEEDALEALAGEVMELGEASLVPRLRGELERATWEDIEAACVVELACERIAEGQIDVVFQAHWELGGAIAAHWFGPALVAARAPLERAMSARGCTLIDIKADEPTTIVVERDGELAIEPAKPGERCGCGPCSALRT